MMKCMKSYMTSSSILIACKIKRNQRKADIETKTYFMMNKENTLGIIKGKEDTNPVKTNIRLGIFIIKRGIMMNIKIIMMTFPMMSTIGEDIKMQRGIKKIIEDIIKMIIMKKRSIMMTKCIKEATKNIIKNPI